MNFRKLLAAACASGLLTLSIGCSQHSQPVVIQPIKDSPRDSLSRTSNTNSPNAEALGNEPFNAPAALERRTAAYSRQMQEMIDANKQPTTEPSSNSLADTSKTSTAQPPNMQSAPGVRATWDDSPQLQSKKPYPRDLPAIPQQSQPQSKKLDLAEKTDNANVPATLDQPAPGSSETSAQPGPVQAKATITPSPAADLSAKLEHRVKDYPRDLSAHLDYQLMRFLLDDRVPDLASLSTLPTEDRELISSLVDGLSNFRNAIRADNNMLLSHKVRPLLDMADRLRGEADLSIPTAALCTRVRTFGEYDPIEPAQFTAGANHDVILYCEVENFSSQIDDQQRWSTKLTQEAVLYSENGMQVWSDKSEPINDLARHRRHDFYVVKRLTIPSSLTVGRYLLKVTVVDQQVSRVAEATVPIVIAVQ